MEPYNNEINDITYMSELTPPPRILRGKRRG